MIRCNDFSCGCCGEDGFCDAPDSVGMECTSPAFQGRDDDEEI